MIPLSTLALVALVTYRGTLLVTGDRITRTARRRLRAWLRRRTHHQTYPGRLQVACSCGWHASVQDGRNRSMILMTHPIPRGVFLGEDELQEDHALERIEYALARHLDQAPDTSRLGYLLECPWCVSIYLGTIGAAIAWAWPAGWWRWPALALAASGVTGLLATIAAPDENDDDD